MEPGPFPCPLGSVDIVSQREVSERHLQTRHPEEEASFLLESSKRVRVQEKSSSRGMKAILVLLAAVFCTLFIQGRAGLFDHSNVVKLDSSTFNEKVSKTSRSAQCLKLFYFSFMF